MTFASVLSFYISSSTDPTMTPPFLSDGISTFSTLSLGSISMPRSFRLKISIGFFFALIILYTFAKRGVFKRRSQVKTAGRETLIF
jgi:hypothetical protein